MNITMESPHNQSLEHGTRICSLVVSLIYCRVLRHRYGNVGICRSLSRKDPWKPPYFSVNLHERSETPRPGPASLLLGELGLAGLGKTWRQRSSKKSMASFRKTWKESLNMFLSTSFNQFFDGVFFLQPIL